MPTPQHLILGRLGEQKAAELLKEKGYKIIETNWRAGHCEVDIIAATREEIIFVEVKTRTSSIGGEPEEAVDTNKRRLIVTAAKAYMTYHQEQRTPRFDVIGIVMKNSGEIEKITHYEHAYIPNLRCRTSGSFTGKWNWKKRKY